MLSNLSEEYKEKLKTIKKHFGEDAQYKKFVEELKELRDFLHYIWPIRSKKSYDELEEFLILQWDNYKKGVLSEIADCYVIAYQINEADFLRSYIEDLNLIPTHLIYQNTWGKVTEIMKFKIDRTLERIESGYYEPDICPICEGAGGFENPYEGGFFADCVTCNGTGKVERKNR